MPAPEPDSYRLTYRFHGRSKTVKFSRPRVLIGRGLDCDLVIGGTDVSRKHAAIEREQDGWTISDLESRHGTFVNRGKIHPGQKQALKPDDVIQIGTVQLKVKA